jgi:hypothetical protein
MTVRLRMMASSTRARRLVVVPVGGTTPLGMILLGLRIGLVRVLGVGSVRAPVPAGGLVRALAVLGLMTVASLI